MNLVKTLFVGLLMTMSIVCGQTQIMPVLTPASINTLVDKAIAQNTKVVSTTLSMVGDVSFSYQVWVPNSYAGTVSITPTAGLLYTGQSVVLAMTINPAALEVGSYQVPVIVAGYVNGTVMQSVTLMLQLNVINSMIPENGPPSATDRVVPHLAVGGGWETVIRLMNYDSAVSQSVIEFRSATGARRKFSVNGIDTYQVPVVLAKNSVSEYRVRSTVAETGVAVVRTLSGGIPAVTVSYYQLNPAKESAVQIKESTSESTLYFNNKGRRSFGVAIGNNYTTDAPVVLEFYNTFGQMFYSQIMTVPAYGNAVFTLEDAIPSTFNVDGVMRVKSVLGVPSLSVFGIQYDLDSGSFSTELGN